MVSIQTFGFKYGHPQCNYWFDVSFIPNPARREGRSLKDKYDAEMLNFVRNQQGVDEIVSAIVIVIETVSQLDDDVRIGIGCNSGRHRSRAVADLVIRKLKGHQIFVTHREDASN